MKKIIYLSIPFFTIALQAQVAIGKQDVSNTSVSLEFAETEARGLILPYVENKTGITVEGTIIYDTIDHKVKYLKDGGNWVNLTEDDGTIETIGKADLTIQTGKPEQSEAKAVIGADGETNTIPGVLVLSDTNKAMVLPIVPKPYDNIINPAPGMMVYDIDAHQLAVFNGTVWSFWKP